jgi:chromate transporter
VIVAAISESSDVVDPSEVTLGALFLGFLKVALLGFGGVLAWARWLIVEQRRWLSAEEFTNVLSLCQFLPGPNIVNVSIYVGGRFRGPLGALAAFTGLMGAPTAIALVLGALYARFGDEAIVRGGFAGISAGAAGLVIATGLKMAAPYRRRPIGFAFGLLALGAVGPLRISMIAVLAVLAPLSVAVAWVRRR